MCFLFPHTSTDHKLLWHVKALLKSYLFLLLWQPLLLLWFKINLPYPFFYSQTILSYSLESVWIKAFFFLRHRLIRSTQCINSPVMFLSSVLCDAQRQAAHHAVLFVRTCCWPHYNLLRMWQLVTAFCLGSICHCTCKLKQNTHSYYCLSLLRDTWWFGMLDSKVNVEEGNRSVEWAV